MDEVPLGFMSRMLIVLVEFPVTDGSEMESAIFQGPKRGMLISRRDVRDGDSKTPNWKMLLCFKP